MLLLRRFYTEVFTHRCFAQRCFCTHKSRHTGAFTHRTFYAEKPLHRTVFTQRNFYTGKLWHRKIAHTDCTKKLHTETFACRNFTQSSFYRSFSAQKPVRTEVFMHSSSYTDAFTHICLYTEQLYTQKLVHTACFSTQPTFTRRGFASPSWSPTFRVPPLKYSRDPLKPSTSEWFVNIETTEVTGFSMSNFRDFRSHLQTPNTLWQTNIYSHGKSP